jgi:hypothetical protein
MISRSFDEHRNLLNAAWDTLSEALFHLEMAREPSRGEAPPQRCL